MEEYNEKVKNLYEDLNKKINEVGKEHQKALLDLFLKKAKEKAKGKGQSEILKDLIQEYQKIAIPIFTLNIQNTINQIIINSIALGIKSFN